MIETFEDLKYYDFLKRRHNIKNFLLYRNCPGNCWWLMIGRQQKHDVVVQVAPQFVMTLKELGKIAIDVSDEEFKIQTALGVINDNYYTIYD